MRAGLSTIQQTLTPEAASVLTHSIAEAARRNHGQTTPLHVAATLLASPAGVLRQACIRSHPHSSHPLQCRALELCFSVALDRLPSTNPTPASPPAGEPPISNALMAALKRAQAHQRRGCPEQQQQPLLAVKVELEQLMISILDDPSVSRVMREASFSSTAVKAAVEQSIPSSTNSSSSATATAVSSASPSPASTSPASPSPAGTLGLNLGLRGAPVAARNIYMYPRLHQHQLNGSNAPAAAVGVGAEQPRTDEVKRVFDILLRSKKRNPVLVGDSDLDAVMREVLQKIESGSAPPPLRNAKVISCDKDLSTSAAGDRSQIPAKIRELNSVIESSIGGERGVLLYLGDLKWLVESHGGASLGSGPAQSQQQQQQPKFSEVGRSAVAEMAKLVKAFEDHGKLWLLGTASCATYLRCQVYHQSMENDWDLQAVPIAPRSPLPHMIPRVAAGNGILSSSVGTLAPMKGYPSLGTTALLPQAPRPESADSARKSRLCPLCMENYERELAKLVAKEFEKSSSKPESNKSLPQWLQLAKSDVKSSADNLKSKEQELMWKQSTEELLKRWNEICTRLHPNFHRAALGSEKPLVPNLLKPLSTCNPRLALEPKLTLSQSYATLRTKCNPETVMPKVSSEQQASPPASPVRTDLVLGSTKSSDSSPEKIHSDRVKDLTGCMQDELSGMQKAKIAGIFDIDSFKRLFKGLTEKVKWQQDAASTIATTVLKRKSGSLKRHNGVTKSDTWFLFIGPDSVGKRKMANALSGLVSGSGLTAICFGDAQHAGANAGESIRNFRGKTAMDQVVETIRRNPLSVILLEDIDQADGLVQGSIKRAMEKGRLPDSYGREVSLGSVIFIVTANWLPEELKNSFDAFIQCEEKILQSANTDWQLELSHGDQPGKRRLDWLCNVNKPNKLRKESSCGLGLSLDLNLAVGTDDDAGEGSRNSSDLTVDHEHGRLAIRSSMSTFVSELMGSVDSVIMFKPVDFAALKKTILESMSMKFTAVMGNQKSLKIDEDVLDHIAGGLWIGSSELDEWSETVIVPGLRQLKTNMKADRPGAIRLSVMKGEGERRGSGRNLLPASVSIVVDGL